MRESNHKCNTGEFPVCVAYLDFDGVLHDDDVVWSRKQGIHMRTPGRFLFEWSHVLEELLRPHPEVKIVLSTSWVRVKSFDFSKKQLTPELQSRVIGATFHRGQMSKFEFDNQPRGAQIFSDVMRRLPAVWFAIDNDDEAWPAHSRQHLIKTDDRLGLSDLKVQAAVRERLEALAIELRVRREANDV
ncbi:HAD domain-containing protein [Duganella sp. Dugasp56]|uniref:HAD domain-containing protein n=1 Tax=Duganella sp. Dugasp56 TaxID=3243046 RepID=UPI0039B053D4